MIDTHCHLLPGLDDGPREREESLLLAERLESVGVRRVVCTLFTERDRVALSRWAGSTPVVRIPFGTELVSRPVPGGPQDGSLLFIGNFVHPPNVDAARRLIESIFPRIRQRCPECELYIVGDQPPRDLVQAHRSASPSPAGCRRSTGTSGERQCSSHPCARVPACG